MKILARGSEHFEKTIEAMRIAAEEVADTLGPNGKNKVLDRGFSVPIITNDGVSVLRALEFEDDIMRMGLELIKEPAMKTNEMAGDGTSTSTVLSFACVEEGRKYNGNPMDLKYSLDQAGQKVVAELKKMARPIKGNEILKVASISAESEMIGQIIADTIEAIGIDGVISVEESKLSDIESKIVEGYELEKGYASHFMANKGNKGNKAEYKNVPVLVIGDKISVITELLPFLQKISASTKELVIFCTEAEQPVVETFVMNKQTGMFNGLIIKCPSQKNEILQDVAIVTGATFVSKEAGFKLEEMDEKVLGKAERITATKDKTIILNGSGSVKSTITALKKELPSITNDNDYDLVEKRIARLGGGVAVISVGARTEQEMRYLYYKVEDAVNATKSAIEEGIVEGGGMALYRISKKLSDENIGERILKKALTAPLRKIIENGGKDYTEILLDMPKKLGYNAKSNKYEDLIQTGVIDPVKVERCAIENAISFAGIFLTSTSTIALKRSEGKDKME